mgnify:CR=1 FL=1
MLAELLPFNGSPAATANSSEPSECDQVGVVRWCFKEERSCLPA